MYISHLRPVRLEKSGNNERLHKMEITPEHRREIEKIAGEIDCPFDLECYKSEFEQLCEVKFLTGTSIVWCVSCLSEESKQFCKLRLPFGSGHLCRCPLRYYIAKNFDR